MGGAKQKEKPIKATPKTLKDTEKQLNATNKALQAEMQATKAASIERDRQQSIQSESQKAENIRKNVETDLASNLQSMAEKQKLLDAQAAQKATQTIAGGSGYNIGTAQQQKISAIGGVGGASSSPPANIPASSSLSAPQVLSSNIGTGGTMQRTNQFTLPEASGIQFGGM